MSGLCPSCRDADGIVSDSLVDQDGMLVVDFECPACGNSWSVTF